MCLFCVCLLIDSILVLSNRIVSFYYLTYFLSFFFCLLLLCLSIIFDFCYIYYIYSKLSLLFHLHLLIKLLFIFFFVKIMNEWKIKRDINLLLKQNCFYLCVCCYKKPSFTFLMYWESCYLNTSQINKYIYYFILFWV